LQIFFGTLPYPGPNVPHRSASPIFSDFDPPPLR